MDEEEVRGYSFDDSTGVGFSEQFAAPDCRGGQRLPRLESGFDERLDLPGQVVGAQRSAAKIRAGRDPHAGPMGEADALDRPLPSMRDSLLPLVADEPGQGR